MGEMCFICGLSVVFQQIMTAVEGIQMVTPRLTSVSSCFGYGRNVNKCLHELLLARRQLAVQFEVSRSKIQVIPGQRKSWWN